MSRPPQPLSNLLKRPRSSSPSPSSSSSPKRSTSETPSESLIDSSGLLNPYSSGMAQSGVGSSPLRGNDGDEGDESGGWVERTEKVHLASSEGGYDQDEISVDEAEGDVGGEKEKLVQAYGDLLGSIPPPFIPWGKYYLLPSTFLAALKSAAMDNETVSTSSFRLDVTELIDLNLSGPGGQEMNAPQVKSVDGRLVLTSTAEKVKVWQIKQGLVEDDDFKFVSVEGWDKLVESFGTVDKPSLPRYCLPKSGRIEMIPPTFTLHIVNRSAGPIPPSSAEANTIKHPIRFTCPTETPLSTLSQFLNSLIQDELSSESETRLWTLETSTTSDSSTLPAMNALELPSTLLPSLAGRLVIAKPETANLTVAESGLDNGDILAIEIGKKSPLGGTMWAVEVNADGKAVEKVTDALPVPSAPAPLFSKPAFFAGSGVASSSTLSPSSQGVQTRSQGKTARRGKGLVGLQNLGNTCFMNSAVQCLSNTQELSEYFQSGVYKTELNPDNPLGMGGEIANSFGTTIDGLWSPNAGLHSSFSPRTLKYVTSRFASQFAGYGQHDTQEFIAFLLDGLHEDLNRIKKKPYVEKPDWKPGGGERELVDLGRECWKGYKARNDSVIVDLFQGQLQSTLVCPECHKESITMDPFMYLTVPLPIAQYRTFKLIYVPLDPERRPMKVSLLIPQNASFMQVKEKLASLVKCNPSNLIGFDLWKGAVYAWWYDADHNGECKDNDVAIFYELPVPVTASRKSVGTISTDSIVVPVYTCQTEHVKSSHSVDCSSQPFFIALSKSEASDPVAVRAAITKGYARSVRDDMYSSMWVAKGSKYAASHLPKEDAFGGSQTDGDDDEPVTEIRLDGDETRVEVVSARSSAGSSQQGGESPHMATSSTLLPSPTASTFANGSLKNASTTSLSTLGSTRSGVKMVPRGDLFRVLVADAGSSDTTSGLSLFKSKDNVIPFFKASLSDASRNWSLLESRKKPRKGVLGHVKSVFGYGSSSSQTDGDDERDKERENGSPPGTPIGGHSAVPVVRPGEGIYCEWSARNYTEFVKSDVEVIGDCEVVVDPAIEKDLAKKKSGKTIHLEDCLDEFSKEETLGQDDLWYCPQCKKHQAATKKLEIYKAPDILVICIKRFGSSRRLSDKLDNMVQFPIDGLDLEDRVGERKLASSLQLSDGELKEMGIEEGNEPMIYDLYAVDNHFGGMGGGHYTAFCRNKVDGEWYNFDDSRVSKASIDAVQSRAAYLLFYRRRTTRPIGGISRVKAEEASRAASPTPASPSPPLPLIPQAESPPPTTLGAFPADLELDASSSSQSDKLPPYSPGVRTPITPASPTLSSDGSERQVRLRQARDTDLGEVGRALGFGNTAWGAGSSHGDLSAGVRHAFATGSKRDAETGLLSPPDSEKGETME